MILTAKLERIQGINGVNMEDTWSIHTERGLSLTLSSIRSVTWSDNMPLNPLSMTMVARNWTTTPPRMGLDRTGRAAGSGLGRGFFACMSMVDVWMYQ